MPTDGRKFQEILISLLQYITVLVCKSEGTQRFLPFVMRHLRPAEIAGCILFILSAGSHPVFKITADLLQDILCTLHREPCKKIRVPCNTHQLFEEQIRHGTSWMAEIFPCNRTFNLLLYFLLQRMQHLFPMHGKVLAHTEQACIIQVRCKNSISVKKGKEFRMFGLFYYSFTYPVHE